MSWGFPHELEESQPSTEKGRKVGGDAAGSDWNEVVTGLGKSQYSTEKGVSLVAVVATKFFALSWIQSHGANPNVPVSADLPPQVWVEPFVLQRLTSEQLSSYPQKTSATLSQ